ncbi:multidrug effflux MFS transporter [Corynebacterium sp. Z-1]|uniref:multidrug effflux MFS transporter n=1 Tax=Corynebacterium TaxID=1716 RepID=UPI00223C52F7|nr:MULTISPECIES: multidrug effflux MFS transporter [Corynebacterium]MCT2288434.1 multidrug effflux MFS transporter [Corynebacterium sanguinis]WNI13213.1 multidrug effflux MFS transporter [Corynebacterium sp. Z-1]
MNSISRSLLVALALLSAVGPFGIDMYLPGLPTLQEDLGTTPAMAQLTITGFMLGMAVGNLLFGALSDSTGRKRPIMIASVCFFAASVLCAIAPSIELLVAARVIQGLAGGSMMVVARAVVPDIARGREAARMFSALMAITGFVPAIAPVIGGVLLPAVGWRGIFWALVVLNAVQTLVAFRVVPETLPPQMRSSRALRGLFPRIARCLARPAFVGYMLASGLGFGALFSYISGSPLVMQRQLGVSPTAFAVIFGSMAMLIPLSNAMNMRVVTRTDPRRALITALLIDGLAGALLVPQALSNPTLVLVVPTLAVLSLMAGFIMANATALGVDSVRDIGAGAGSGAMGFFQYVVAGAIPPLVALGTNPMLAMGISIIACSGIALVALATLTRRTE